MQYGMDSKNLCKYKVIQTHCHNDRSVYTVEVTIYYCNYCRWVLSLYTVNFPLHCRQDCLYMKTKEPVNIATYLQRLSL